MNVICIFITAIIFLKIKEVAAPYTSTPDLRRFWEKDIKVAREANRAHLYKAEDDERTEYAILFINKLYGYHTFIRNNRDGTFVT